MSRPCRQCTDGSDRFLSQISYENLRPEYRLYIRRQDFHTLSELLIFIEQYEELIREQPRHTNHGIHEGPNTPLEKPTPPNKPVKSPPFQPNPFTQPILGWPGSISARQPPPTSFNRETDCWRCGQSGHTRFKCPNPYFALCSYCGRPGDRRRCPCQSENGQRGPSDPSA